MEFSFWFRILKFRIFELEIQSIFDSIFYIYFILCLWKDLRFSNSDVSTNTVICSYIHVTYSSIWGGVRLEFFFLTEFLLWFCLPKFTQNRWVYQRKEVSLTLWLWVVKEAKLSVIHIRKFLITKEKWVCLSEIQQKKIRIKFIEMRFCFPFFVLLGTSLYEQAYENDFISMTQATTSVQLQTIKNTIIE